MSRLGAVAADVETIYHSDVKTLATGDHEFAAKLWDVPAIGSSKEVTTSERPRFVFPNQRAWISAVHFDPAGDTLALASGNGVVCLWNLAEIAADLPPDSLKPRARIKEPKEVTTIAFSPDGKLLATGSHNVPVELWDARTGELTATFPHAEYRPKSVAFSPDGQSLSTGDESRIVRLWSVSSRQMRAILPGHQDDVNGVAFHPSGRRLISAGRTGDIPQKLAPLAPFLWFECRIQGKAGRGR